MLALRYIGGDGFGGHGSGEIEIVFFPDAESKDRIFVIVLVYVFGVQ